MTTMDHTLEAAYRATSYWVWTEPLMCWSIGTQNHQLMAHYQRQGVDCCALITAHNPFSEPRSAAWNDDAQGALETQLDEAGWAWVQAVGAHPNGQWPPERSALIWGMDRAEALRWAERLDQRAVVFAGADGAPELLWFS